VASIAALRKPLSYSQALAHVLGAARTLPAEIIPLGEARGRALRQTLPAPHALPPFRNSAVDGYAVRSADLAGATAAQPIALRMVGTLPAGRVAPDALPPGGTMRIMTGAMIPTEADAVVPLEEVEAPRDKAGPRFTRAPGASTNVREAGRDLAAGAPALEDGRELSPHDLALLASLGFARIPAGPRPRVVVLSTGSELLDIGAPLEPGRIRDSNSLMLRALLDECGANLLRGERLPDDPMTVSRAIADALRDADVVLSIGGISVGDFDPVRQAVAGLPWIEVWRVAMRPGQPQAFGALDGRLFFGLPGNPASVACVFESLVRPALRQLQGFAHLERPRIEVRAAVDIESRAGRTDFVRATLEWRERTFWATPAGDQVSGHLTPQSRAHALVVIAAERERLAAGAGAEALLLRWPG
jgi:molybdopterin molybdotransferase